MVLGLVLVLVVGLVLMLETTGYSLWRSHCSVCSLWLAGGSGSLVAGCWLAGQCSVVAGCWLAGGSGWVGGRSGSLLAGCWLVVVRSGVGASCNCSSVIRSSCLRLLVHPPTPLLRHHTTRSVVCRFSRYIPIKFYFSTIV